MAQALSEISPAPSLESAGSAETTVPHPRHTGHSFKVPGSSVCKQGNYTWKKIIKDHELDTTLDNKSNNHETLYLLKKSNTSTKAVRKRVGTWGKSGKLKMPFVWGKTLASFKSTAASVEQVLLINYSLLELCTFSGVDKLSDIQSKLILNQEFKQMIIKMVECQFHSIWKRWTKENGRCCLQEYDNSVALLNWQLYA